MFNINVDPDTIKLKVDFDLKGAIENSIYMAAVAAHKNNKPYILFYEEVNGEPNYKVESKEWNVFWNMEFTCPQDADLAYLNQFKTHRPVPSASIIPPGQPVIAKPNLCDTCEHKLARTLSNNCKGLTYKHI